MEKMIERLKGVYKDYPNAIYIIRIIEKEGIPIDYEYLYANPASEKITGIVPEEVVGKMHNAYFHGMPDQNIWAYYTAVKQGRSGKAFLYSAETGKNLEVAYMPVDRETCLIESKHLQGNVPSGSHDKSDAKSAFFHSSGAEEKMILQDCLDSPSQKEEFHREVDELSAISMLFMSSYRVDLKQNRYTVLKQSEAESKMLSPSGRWQDLVHIYTETMIENHKYIYSSAYLLEYLNKKLSDKNPVVTVESSSSLGGQIKWLRHSMVLTKMGEQYPEKGIYMIQDVTAERELERQKQEALRIAFDSARCANEAKTSFLSSMSHDIRTPMNAIIGMTAIAGMHLDDSVRVKDCLNKIDISSKHLLALINEVLDMSKIESGKVELGNEKFKVSELLDNIMSMIRQQMKEKEQNIHVHIGQLTHEAVSGDPYRLQQIFMNLLSNAVKYTPEGGMIHMEFEEVEMLSIDAARYRLVIEDNGIGMSEEFQKIMFEPFSRAEDTRTNQVHGTGLGMAIVRNLVRLMGGDISVESELNKGTRVTVELVLGLQTIDERVLKKLEHKKILIADDNLTICKSVQDMIQGIGMQADYVLNGEACVKKVIEAQGYRNEYFACLIDWDMPEMNGVETTKKIRKFLGPELPIIMMSSYDKVCIEEDAIRAGATTFVSKPLFPSKLAYLFHSLLEKQQPKVQECTPVHKQGKRVLIVEDNEMNMEIAAEIISDTGVLVEKAVNGTEAVNKVMESPEKYFDMIFMDIQMPGIDGYQAAKSIRRLERKDVREIPVIAMTANAFHEDILKTKEAGMDGHIAKPIDINDLYKTLEEWLE